MQFANTTTITAALNSWTGDAPLRPGAYGEKTCQCEGVLAATQGGTGWVRVLREVDHPAARWNQGKIYLARRDLRQPTVDLRPGDHVSFYLYVDSKGLGAEDCYLVRHASPESSTPTLDTQWTWHAKPKWSSWGTGAQGWEQKKPWWADKECHSGSRWPIDDGDGPSPCWSSPAWVSKPAHLGQSSVSKINPALTEDDGERDADESDIEAPKKPQVADTASTCSDNDEIMTNSSYESSEQGCGEEFPESAVAASSDSTEEDEVQSKVRVLAYAPLLWDADVEDLLSDEVLPPPPGLARPSPIGAPPGLPPPPGLALAPAGQAVTLSLADML